MSREAQASRHRRAGLLVAARKKLGGSTRDPVFHSIHNHQLVFNLCWEDPRIDRQLLNLKADSKVVVITSAGCNALDYLLDNPAEVHAVDINPRQNALLELKLAIIRHADFDDLFAMFGAGHHRDYRRRHAELRMHLSPETRLFWDDKIYYFDRSHLKRSFYYHGPLGLDAPQSYLPGGAAVAPLAEPLRDLGGRGAYRSYGLVAILHLCRRPNGLDRLAVHPLSPHHNFVHSDLFVNHDQVGVVAGLQAALAITEADQARRIKAGHLHRLRQ